MKRHPLLACVAIALSWIVGLITLTAARLDPLVDDGELVVISSGARAGSGTVTTADGVADAASCLVWESDELPGFVSDRRVPIRYPGGYAWDEDRWETLIRSGCHRDYDLSQRIVTTASGEEHLVMIEDSEAHVCLTIWALGGCFPPEQLFHCSLAGYWCLTTPLIVEGKAPLVAMVSTEARSGSWPPPSPVPQGIVVARYDGAIGRYEVLAPGWGRRCLLAAQFLWTAPVPAWPIVSVLVFVIGMFAVVLVPVTTVIWCFQQHPKPFWRGA